MVEGNETRIEPGMVFTDEPGIYQLNKFGVRIEADCVMTDSGVELLSPRLSNLYSRSFLAKLTIRSSAFLMESVAAAYESRTHRSSPKAAPGTSATPVWVISRVQKSVPVIFPNES